VTSASGNGNLFSWPHSGGATGIAAGDAICQKLASDALLDDPAQYKAWLSDSTVDAKARFQTSGPWVRPDGTLIARDASSLTQGDLLTAIDQTETGLYFGAATVWTGTSNNGTKQTNTCTNWTTASSATQGVTGQADDSTFWTDQAPSTPCNITTAHLYCLGGASLKLFSDGFELGTTAAWSHTGFF